MVFAQLGAQPLDVHRHGRQVPEVPPPHLLEQVLAGEDGVGMGEEEDQQVELPVGEADAPPPHRHGPRGGGDHQLTGGDVAGQTLLIQGGAGTVGYLAVQFAAWAGARVIATTGASGVERAKSAGAQVVLDYSASDLAQQVLDANGGAPVDQIIEVEFGANIALDAEVIKPNGRIAAYGSAKVMEPTLPFLPLLFKAVTIDIILVYLLTEAERALAIKKTHQALAEGALHCPVEQTFALSDTVKAHEAVEAGARAGAILINCEG